MNKRIQGIIILLTVFALIIAVHFGRIMLAPTESANIPSSILNVERGPILDRNGRLLAIQTELPTVTVWTPYIDEKEQVATSLSQILNIPYEEILAKLNIANRDIIIKRTIPPAEAEVIGLLKQQGELRGVNLRRSVERIYPEGRSASHVIGFVGTENIGLEGIEFTQDSLLSPPSIEPGERSYGKQIFLTLDIVIQHAVEEIADRLMEEHGPDSVMVIVMDAKSAEILSYVSKPDYNPNTFNEYDDDSRRNRPVQMSYEPGSVFKVFSLTAIMQLGGIGDDSIFNTSGGYLNSQINIPITDLGDYGNIGPEGIITFSSNVGAAYASDTVDRRNFSQMLQQFGFGQVTGIELNGEEQGLLAPVNRWSGRSKPTIAIGQEVGVTAIQMVQAATALANKGSMLRPQIIKRIVDSSGELIQEQGRQELRKVLRSDVAEQMLRYMQNASRGGGTGRRVFIEGTNISVKTGTGEVFDPARRAYSDELFVASTLAILPTEDPELIIYLVIQHPRGESFLGGVIAAPAVREVAAFLIPYLQIGAEPDTQGLPQTLEILEPVLPDITLGIPDFRGLPLSTVVPLYARRDISVQIYGSGWVKRQVPPPGSEYQEGMHIELYLEPRLEDE